jgi:hypothetical protein
MARWRRQGQLSVTPSRKLKPVKTPKTIITRIVSFIKIVELANPAKLANSVVRYMVNGQFCELANSVLQSRLAKLPRKASFIGTLIVTLILTLTKAKLREIGQNSNAVVAYDNFDFYEKVKHQVLGDNGMMRSVTTGKVFIGHDIPLEGLQQSMHHPDVPLRYGKDVLCAPGAQRDDIQADIRTFFITETVRKLYPKAVHQIWAQSSDKDFPCMPKIDVLNPRQTKSYSLGAIPFSEGTIDGNYQVHKSIFVNQFGLDPKEDFKNRLYLVYGDQKPHNSSALLNLSSGQLLWTMIVATGYCLSLLSSIYG